MNALLSESSQLIYSPTLSLSLSPSVPQDFPSMYRTLSSVVSMVP